MEIKTLNDIYTVTCSLARPAALKYKRDGKWVDTSVDEFRDTVRYFATGLRLLGLKAGDRVAILSENRPEWAYADLATRAARTLRARPSARRCSKVRPPPAGAATASRRPSAHCGRARRSTTKAAAPSGASS